MYVSDPVNDQVALEARLAEAQKQLAELGEVTPHVASGDAAEALARYGASVDLLVPGSHEYRPRDRFSGGTTA